MRFRRATGDSWPPLFDSVLEYALPADSLRELSIRLHRAGFFELPALIEDPAITGGRFCWLRLRSFGRTHAVTARGKSTERFDRVLGEIAEVLPAGCEVESPAGTIRRATSRPSALPSAPLPDLERSLRYHQQWLAREPGRSDLHLDLFALHLARGEREAARREALALRGDPQLGALVDGLLRRL